MYSAWQKKLTFDFRIIYEIIQSITTSTVSPFLQYVFTLRIASKSVNNCEINKYYIHFDINEWIQCQRIYHHQCSLYEFNWLHVDWVKRKSVFDMILNVCIDVQQHLQKKETICQYDVYNPFKWRYRHFDWLALRCSVHFIPHENYHDKKNKL